MNEMDFKFNKIIIFFTNTEKSIMTGKIVSSFSVGSKILCDFMNNNPYVGRLNILIVV